jgi:hypothetical protein
MMRKETIEVWAYKIVFNGQRLLNKEVAEKRGNRLCFRENISFPDLQGKTLLLRMVDGGSEIWVQVVGKFVNSEDGFKSVFDVKEISAPIY